MSTSCCKGRAHRKKAPRDAPPRQVHVHGVKAEEVGHAYGPARNSVSRMVSKHYKINVETALEVRFCTCLVATTC